MPVPSSFETELAAVGSLLLDQETVSLGLPVLKAEFFYDDKLRAVFSAIRDLAMTDSPVDTVTVFDKVKEHRQDVTVDELQELKEKTPSSVHIEYYADILNGYYKARKLLEMSTRVSNVAMTSNPQKISELVTRFSDDLHTVLAETAACHTAKDVMTAMWDKFQEAYDRGGNVETTTGFVELDALTGGYNRGDLLVVGGRPSTGKTSLMLSSMLELVKTATPCAFFSYEMPQVQVGQRLAAMDSGVPLLKIRTTAGLTSEEMDKFVRSTGWISGLPFYVDDAAGDIYHLAASIRRYVRTKQVRVVYIDYLGLIPMYTDNPVVELGNFTRTLKLLATNLGITVVLGAQLNRSVEGRADGVPRLSDLRQSGRIEEDADIVTFIHRKKDVLPEDATLLTSKNRNGPVGAISLFFDPLITKFTGRGA